MTLIPLRAASTKIVAVLVRQLEPHPLCHRLDHGLVPLFWVDADVVFDQQSLVAVAGGDTRARRSHFISIGYLDHVLDHMAWDRSYEPDVANGPHGPT